MIVILSILLLGAALALPNYGGKIIGGHDAKEGAYPYVVSLRYNGYHQCGASILNKRFILTAAHCVYDSQNNPEDFAIIYGTVNLDNKKNVRQVSKIIMHPGYNDNEESGYPNDVAVLKLEEDIIFGDNAQPVKIAKPTDYPVENAEAILVGWGSIYMSVLEMKRLQEVTLTLFSDALCKSTDARYSAEFHVCAGVGEGGKGQCNGDSGGPLTVKGVQYGIVSWSVKPCASKGHPGIFTRVSRYFDWIRKALAE